MNNNLTISEKEKIFYNTDYANHEDFSYKISVLPLQFNVIDECYRDQLVSYYQMAPLINKSVKFHEADYIIYANPYARVEDFTDSVLEDLKLINENKKENAEIIIVGKATNIKPYIEGKYSNITYVDRHYTEYLGKRFNLNIKEQYFVYDDRNGNLNIWPVDGCQNKCGFCRRTYMHIPFESQPIEFIKEQLDFFKENYPEQMKNISLRAENLTQYGLDIYGKQTLNKVIDLIDSYDEVKKISLPIGMCIGEITPEILDSLCRTKKINQIALNLEAGSNRLLALVGKKHTREMAIDICNKILNANPNIVIDTTVMVGLPTENFEDMLLLGDLILKCHINYVHCNYYGFSPKHPIAKYEQLTEQVRQQHLDFLIKYLKKNYDGDYILQMRHETMDDKRKRSVQREIKKIQEDQKYVLPKLLRVKVENFVGNNISIKSNDIINDENTLDKEYQKVLKNIKNSKFKSHL